MQSKYGAYHVLVALLIMRMADLQQRKLWCMYKHQIWLPSDSCHFKVKEQRISSMEQFSNSRI